jgi:tetratricopeptide (TPR) repeat protein
VSVQRWEEARQDWEDHFQGLEHSIETLGVAVGKVDMKVENLVSASEAADSLTHTKLDAVLLGQGMGETAEQAALERKELKEGMDDLKQMLAHFRNQEQQQQELEDSAAMSTSLEGIHLTAKLKEAKRLLTHDLFTQASVRANEVLASDSSNIAANLILAFALYGSAKESLRGNEYVDAIKYLDAMLTDPPSQMPPQRKAHARTYKAFAQYALAKQYIEKRNYLDALALLEDAKKSNKLPPKQRKKSDDYIRRCNSKIDALALDQDMDDDGGDGILSLDEWLVKYGLTSVTANICDVLDAAGRSIFSDVHAGVCELIDTPTAIDLLDIEEKDLENILEEGDVKKIKKKAIRRCISELQSAMQNGDAYALLNNAKALYSDGQLDKARDCLREAQKCRRQPAKFKAAVQRLLENIKEDETLEINTSTLISLSQTLDMDTSLLSATHSIQANVGNSSSQVVAYLKQEFPMGEIVRRQFETQVKVDCARALSIDQESIEVSLAQSQSQALATPTTEIPTYAESRAVVATLIFAGLDSSIVSKYLEQVQDSKSKIYDGKVTRTLDAELTLGMSTQLVKDREEGSTREYHIGQRVVISQVGEVYCEVRKFLGKGKFGKVYEVLCAEKQSALKVFNTTKVTSLCDEASLALYLSYPHQHEHVLPMEFVCVKEDTKELFFLADYVDAGDLKSWINSDRLYDGEDAQVDQRLLRVSHQISLGVAFLVSPQPFVWFFVRY